MEFKGIVIGSRALNYHSRLPPGRIMDLDLLMGEEENIIEFCDKGSEDISNLEKCSEYKYKAKSKKYGQIEFEIANKTQAGQLYYDYCLKANQIYKLDGIGYYRHELIYAPLEVLFSLKKSHIFYPIHWQKNIEDYHLIKDIIQRDTIPEITAIRREETKLWAGKNKTPSLNKSAEDFFDDNVSNRHFIHDEIHGIMAHFDRPLYESIKESNDKVLCSKDLFHKLSQEQRLKCVLEEAYVIALERKILPMLFDAGPIYTANEAVKYALMRICTTLTGGWFREFAVENYPALSFDAYQSDYVIKFLTAFDEGRIKRIKKNHK